MPRAATTHAFSRSESCGFSFLPFAEGFRAGGVPAVLKSLLPLLDGDAPTVSGGTIAEVAAGNLFGE